MTIQPRAILEYVLPFIATAGEYSAVIQKRIGVHDAKQGNNLFQHALSDADLTVQSFLEVILLARFPGLSFFSEEQEKSLNAKYFPSNADYEILVDPIDGTRIYVDGGEQYQIIMTIHDLQQVVGALCYQPRRDRCWIAVKGEGAYLLTREEMSTGASWKPFRIQYQGGPVSVFNSPSLVERISPVMPIKDRLASYATEPNRYFSTDIFEGLAAAKVHQPCQAIDGGAIAFIAQEAGAIVSDFSGAPLGSYRAHPKRTLPEVVVAANEEIHATLLRALGGLDHDAG